MADKLARETKAVYKAALEQNDIYVRVTSGGAPLTPLEAAEFHLAIENAILDALLFLARQIDEV